MRRHALWLGSWIACTSFTTCTPVFDIFAGPSGRRSSAGARRDDGECEVLWQLEALSLNVSTLMPGLQNASGPLLVTGFPNSGTRAVAFLFHELGIPFDGDENWDSKVFADLERYFPLCKNGPRHTFGELPSYDGAASISDHIRDDASKGWAAYGRTKTDMHRSMSMYFNETYHRLMLKGYGIKSGDSIAKRYADLIRLGVWGAKEPLYIWHLHFLLWALPKSVGVLVLRDGRDLASSLMKNSRLDDGFHRTFDDVCPSAKGFPQTDLDIAREFMAHWAAVHTAIGSHAELWKQCGRTQRIFSLRPANLIDETRLDENVLAVTEIVEALGLSRTSEEVRAAIRSVSRTELGNHSGAKGKPSYGRWRQHAEIFRDLPADVLKAFLALGFVDKVNDEL